MTTFYKTSLLCAFNKNCEKKKLKISKQWITENLY